MTQEHTWGNSQGGNFSLQSRTCSVKVHETGRGQNKTSLSHTLEDVSEAYSALAAWEDDCPGIGWLSVFFQPLQQQGARSDTLKSTLVFRTWLTFSLAMSPPALSNCEGPAGAGASRDVSVRSFAGVSQSKWQDLFYHAEPSPVSRAARWNFLLWRPPLCCCVAKGFCRLLYCLNSHQICIIIQIWKKDHEANIKPKISSQRPHQGLLTLMCLKLV